MSDKHTVVHTEVMQLQAPLATVREYILTPARILDYYPGGIAGEVLESGQSMICRSDVVASLLELVAEQSSDQCLVLKVTSAAGLEAPFTAERIQASPFFTMYEDWRLEASGEGTTLSKSWRDITAPDPDAMPFADMVREGAIAESEHLVAAWNKVFQQSQ